MFFSIAVFIAGCSSAGPEQEYTFLNGHHGSIPPLPKEEHYTVLFNNMDGYWKHGQTVNVKGVNINTFIPHTEFIDTWSERIEMTHINVDSSMTAQKYYMQIVQSDLNNICDYSVPKAIFLKQNTNDIIYEYRILNCGKKPSIALIGRIMHNGNNINTITYTVKTDNLESARREYMLEIIESTQVV